jgi:CRP/FNR family transcriptional regulator
MLQNPNLPHRKTSCFSCGLRELCLPVGLEEDEINALDSLINRWCKIRRGGYLYRAGMDFQSLYIVRSGFFKTYVLHEDGREQVTGFHMPGEMLGLEAISTDVHTCHAVALENSEICEIPFTKLEEIGRDIPSLMHHFHKIMSRKIVHNHEAIALLGGMKARERLITLLLNLSDRFAKLGYSSSNFNLCMTREEIGSYLGLKLETVSRAFSRLQKDGLIKINSKSVQLNNISWLKQRSRGNFHVTEEIVEGAEFQ